MTPDHIGWIGTALFAIGGVTVAHKRRSSFLYMLAANTLYAIVGWLTSLPSLITVSIFMGVIDVYGWYTWTVSERRDDGRGVEAKSDHGAKRHSSKRARA